MIGSRAGKYAAPEGEQVEPTAPARVVQVPISLLVDASPRLSGEDPKHVRLLAESISSLPPISVHRATMRVIDGMHRIRAAQLVGNEEIAVEFFDGDEDEAFVLSVQANTQHGLPLTKADRKSAAARILDKYPQWSDRAIAKVTGLSPKTVGVLRAPVPDGVDDPTPRVGLDGRTRPVDHRTRRLRAANYLAGKPLATTDEIVLATGLSRRSARDVRLRSAKRAEDPQPEPRDVIRILRSDPALRNSDGGRAFLRLLGAAEFWAQNAEQLIESLPPHCLGTLSDALSACAGMVGDVANVLKARS